MAKVIGTHDCTDRRGSILEGGDASHCLGHLSLNGVNIRVFELKGIMYATEDVSNEW